MSEEDGDLCRMLRDHRPGVRWAVEHHCAMFADGVVTDLDSGRVLARPQTTNS